MRSSRWRWHLDEVFVRINGVQHYLWRAVDHEGEVLEAYVSKTRDKKRPEVPQKLMKRHGRPEELVTDGLSPTGLPQGLGAEDRQVTGRWENNRVENSTSRSEGESGRCCASGACEVFRRSPRPLLSMQPLQLRSEPLQPQRLQAEPRRRSCRVAAALRRLRSARLSNSRPVRIRLTAPLKVLEADGVLEIHPRSGIQFVRPGVELTRSTYQFRGILERAAVRVFSDSTPLSEIEGTIEAHEALLHDLTHAPRAEDLPERAAELEMMFHGGVIGSLDNRQIDAAYRRLATLLRIIRLDSAWSPRTLGITLQEHLDVLERARARDADGAEEAMRRHLNGALQRHLKVL
jgi:DNA-binding GntR family transcriptional regulator